MCKAHPSGLSGPLSSNIFSSEGRTHIYVGDLDPAARKNAPISPLNNFMHFITNDLEYLKQTVVQFVAWGDNLCQELL